MSGRRPLAREKRNVTKKEIVRTISEEIGLTQLKTKEIVQKTFDAIVETLVEDGRIELRNFGVFEVKKREPRKARNPRTGAEVYVPAKNVGANLAPILASGGPAGEYNVPVYRDAQEVEVIEAQPLDIADALKNGREPVGLGAVPAERESLRFGSNEWETLARREERVDEPCRGLVH